MGTTEPMRVLVVVYEYPPVGGGGGRVAQDLAHKLAGRGHAVRILTAHLKGLPLREQEGNVEVVRLPSLRDQAFKAGIKPMAGYIGAALLAGGREIRDFHPDVIHTHFAVPSGAAAMLLSAFSGIPYVLTAHLGDVPGGVPEKTGKWFRLIQPFTPPIWKRASAVVAVSEFTRSLALKAYPVEVGVIPNGVALVQLDPGVIEVHQPPRLVFAGRFMAQKNPLQVVRVLERLKDLPWQAAMLGDGPLHAETAAAVKAAGLEDRVEMPGWVTPEQVLARFKESDILFHPSLSEGLPVVGVQAMAMGLALVVGKAGGFVELVEPGVNGFIHEAHDTSAFEASLRELLCNPAALLTLRRASRASAANFDLEKIVDAYERVLSGAISARK